MSKLPGTIYISLASSPSALDQKTNNMSICNETVTPLHPLLDMIHRIFRHKKQQERDEIYFCTKRQNITFTFNSVHI